MLASCKSNSRKLTRPLELPSPVPQRISANLLFTLVVDKTEGDVTARSWTSRNYAKPVERLVQSNFSQLTLRLFFFRHESLAIFQLLVSVMVQIECRRCFMVEKVYSRCSEAIHFFLFEDYLKKNVCYAFSLNFRRSRETPIEAFTPGSDTIPSL